MTDLSNIYPHYLEPELSLILDMNSKLTDFRTSIINQDAENTTMDNEWLELRGTRITQKRGDLFLNFINNDFADYSDFIKFASIYGINGLIRYASNSSEITQYLDQSNEIRIKSFVPEKVIITFVESVFHDHGDTFTNAKVLFWKILNSYLESKSEAVNSAKSSLEIYFDNCASEFHKPLSRYSGAIRIEYEANKQIKSNGDMENVFNKVFYSTDILAVVYHDFFAALENSSFNVCKNCGIVFTPRSRIDETYCDSCKSLAYENKIKDDPILAAYNAAYKARHKERQRNIKALKASNASDADIKIWENTFNSWIDYAKSKQQEVQENKITIEEYKKSLKVRLEDILNGAHRKAW